MKLNFWLGSAGVAGAFKPDHQNYLPSTFAKGLGFTHYSLVLGPGVGVTPPGDGIGVGAISGVQYGFWQHLFTVS